MEQTDSDSALTGHLAHYTVQVALGLTPKAPMGSLYLCTTMEETMGAEL